jgi:AraC-like DNA-binding protein
MQRPARVVSTPAPQGGDFRIHEQAVSGPLARFCKKLLAVDVRPQPRVRLTVVPHPSFVLSLQFAHGTDALAARHRDASLTHLCGLRTRRHSYQPAGGCRTFFAQLTPEAGLAIAGGGLRAAGDGPRVALSTLLPSSSWAPLEARMAAHADAGQQLAVLGEWIEERIAQAPPLPRGARRAVEVAADLFEAPSMPLDNLGARHAASRRQIERDVANWLHVTPKHLCQVARMQAAMRMARAGHSLAEAAHGAGFADQAHMTRVVCRLTGCAPGALQRRSNLEPNTLFTHYAGRATVYVGERLQPHQGESAASVSGSRSPA